MVITYPEAAWRKFGLSSVRYRLEYPKALPTYKASQMPIEDLGIAKTGRPEGGPRYHVA